MNQFYSGQHGQLHIRSAASGNYASVGNLKNWSINFTMPVLECTSLGDTDRTILHGVRSFSGSSSLLYYSSTTSNVNLMTRNFIFGRSSNRTDYNSKTFGQILDIEILLLGTSKSVRKSTKFTENPKNVMKCSSKNPKEC